MMAVGNEICEAFAGTENTLTDVENMFAHLATLPDSQYSHLNTLVATDDQSGEVMGVCIAYDGALLHQLRQRFFEAATQFLNRHMDGMADETSSDEFYIDTLATFPQYRKHGVATALLKATIERAARLGKPAALLVDKSNPRAAALYHELGFRYVDDRPFADVVMSHLRY